MRIQVDKVEKGWPHALNAHEVRLIFQTVPPAWTEGIREVRISNSLTSPRTFFSRYSGCLTVYSRNKGKKQALQEVLCELAAIGARLDRGLRRRPKAIRARLEKMSDAYVEQLWPSLAPSPIRHISLEGFKEMHFPLVSNNDERPDENAN
jgi:hypothetical protein